MPGSASTTPTPAASRRAYAWGVAAATALLAAALLGWALVTPGFRAPDEPDHLSAVLDLASTGEWADPNTAPLDSGMRLSYASFGFPGAANVFPAPDPVSAAALPTETPTLSELEELPAPVIDADMTNQITQHPPLYYAYLAGVLRLFGLADAPVTTMLLVLRLASALLLLPIPALIASTAARIGLPPTAGLVGALVPAAWVQFGVIGATVNNGALLALTSTLFLAMMARVVTGDLRTRIAVIGGAALALALLTKGFALALAPLGLFAYLWRWRADRSRIWRPMIVAAAIALLGTGFYVYTIARFGTLATVSQGRAIPFDAERLSHWPAAFLESLSNTMWMNLGWIETPLQPSAIHITLSLAALALIVIGSWRLRGAPGLVILLNAAWLLTLVMFSIPSARTWLWNETIRAAQGRYLHQAVLAIALLLAMAIARWRWVAIIAPGATALVIAGTLWGGAKYFWEGESFADPAVAWPAGGILLAVVAGLLVAASVVGTIAASRLRAPAGAALSAPRPQPVR